MLSALLPISVLPFFVFGLCDLLFQSLQKSALFLYQADLSVPLVIKKICQEPYAIYHFWSHQVCCLLTAIFLLFLSFRAKTIEDVSRIQAFEPAVI